MWKRAPKFKVLSKHVLLVKSTQAPGTHALAKHYLERLTRFFGEKRVSEISEVDWGEYVSECKRSAPKRKLHDDKKFMSQVMLVAYRRGFLPRPISLKIPCAKSEIGREITTQEIGRLFALAGPRLRFQMEIALTLGLRRSEMLFLKWDRFRWKDKAIQLHASDTKTRRGRLVPLTLELFHQFRARHAMKKSVFVFPHRFDRSRPQRDNKTAWKSLKRRAVVKCRWHDWRHTCATLLLRNGVPVAVAAAYLGMSERILNGIYRHLNFQDLKAAADSMRRAAPRRRAAIP